jgi:reactive chlorine resistance protein C
MSTRQIQVAGDRVTASAARLERAGTGVLRYGVVFLLLVFGAAKFFMFEAQGIRPLVENSPFLSWMLGAFGLRGTSNVIGAIEIATALAIASRPVAPTVSAIGSAAGALTFMVTLSFLFSTPGALVPTHPANGFLVKDVILLGACLVTCSEALRAARHRHGTSTETPVSTSAPRVA